MAILDFRLLFQFQIHTGTFSATMLGLQRNADTINEIIPALRH